MWMVTVIAFRPNFQSPKSELPEPTENNRQVRSISPAARKLRATMMSGDDLSTPRKALSPALFENRILRLSRPQRLLSPISAINLGCAELWRSPGFKMRQSYAAGKVSAMRPASDKAEQRVDHDGSHAHRDHDFPPDVHE